MTLYMAVTADEYELPLYVTESAAEMARWLGYSRTKTVHEICCRNAGKPPRPNVRGETKRLRRITVDIEEDET